MPQRRVRAFALLVLSTLFAGFLVQAGHQARAADPVPVTYQDQTYPAVAGQSPAADKPQSKLWWNDGAWWGLLRAPTGGVTIHRLVDHAWQNTGTVVDNRPESTGDALWDGSKLYVASRVASGALRAVRLSYSTTTKAYAVDFSQQVAAGGSESITIAKDSLARLWVTYTQGSRVLVAHSAPNSDQSWSAPFLLPVPDNTVTPDDISAIIAFRGQVGVMFSDQGAGAMRFAVHKDADPDSTWTVEDAYAGTRAADDHINLKSIADDAQGRIYAAVKTSRGDNAADLQTDPSIVVLQRTPGASAGSWVAATAATVAEKLTRAQLALDPIGRLYVLMANEGGGSVFYKSSGLTTLSFPTGTGAPFIRWTGASINNPSTSKDPVDATTGLVVLAADDVAHRYYHGELALGTTDTTAPTVPQGVTATATSETSVTVSWQASTDDVGVTGYRVYRDGTLVGSPATTSYADSGLTASTQYGYTVKALDAANNVSAQSAAVSVTTPAGTPAPSGVTFVAARTAAGTSTSTPVAAPVGVQAGDVLVASVSVRGNPTIGTPAGWTLVRMDPNSTTMRQALFTRVAGSAEGTATWTFSSAQTNVVQVLAYRGVSTTSPVVASGGALSATASIVSPGVDSVAGGRVLTFAGQARIATLTPATGLTERSAQAGSSTAKYKVTGEAAEGSTGGTPTGSFTTKSDGSAGGIGQTLTLRPAA